MGFYFSVSNHQNNSHHGNANYKSIYYIVILSSIILLFFTYGIQALNIHNSNQVEYYNQPQKTIDQSLYTNNNNKEEIQTQLQQEKSLPYYSKIKIINTLINSKDERINIIFNNSFEFIGINYLSVSEYIKIPTGQLDITLISSDNKVVINRDSFSIHNDSYYTLIISGNTVQSNGRDNSKLTILSDNNHFPINSKRNTIRFIHCSSDTPQVDLSIYKGATLFSNISFIGSPLERINKKFKNQLHSSTNFISMPIKAANKKPYQVYLHKPENTSLQIMEPESLLNGAPVTTILLVGLQNNTDLYPLQLLFIPYPLPTNHHVNGNGNNNNDNNNANSINDTDLPIFRNSKSLLSNQQQQFPQQFGSSDINSLSPPSLLNFIIAIFSFLFLALLSFI